MRHQAGPVSQTGVILATISFYPEISGTGQILTDLAESLAEQGMDVHVYTAYPHYYQKHEETAREEFYKGIRITRIPSTTFDKNRRFGRILNWITFTLSAFRTLLFDRTNYPLLLVSSPPILPFIGWPLKILKRKRFVILMHDVYPDIGVKLGYFRENGPTVRIWNFFNRLVYGRGDKIVVLAEDMASVVAEKLNGESGKIRVIHNWADETLIRPIEKDQNLFLKENRLPHHFLVQYAGNLGFNHELEPLIEAARRLTSSSIGFVFIGEGGKKEKLQSLVREYDLRNVSFFPFQPRELLPHALGASDLSVVTLERGVEGFAVPSKFYSILASGRPVLAILGERCEMAELIREYGCGFVVPQGDIEQIVRIVRDCRQNPERTKQMGESSRRCFEKNFTRRRATRAYQDLIEQLSANRCSSKR